MVTKKEAVTIHRHCNGCSKPVPLKESFCSKDCAKTFLDQRKKQQRSTMLFMGLIFVAVMFFLFSSAFCAGPVPPPQ